MDNSVQKNLHRLNLCLERWNREHNILCIMISFIQHFNLKKKNINEFFSQKVFNNSIKINNHEKESLGIGETFRLIMFHKL